MYNRTITIHFDFTSGKELSYVEGLNSSKDFCTNCLEFFSFDTVASQVFVVRSDGSYIELGQLLKETRSGRQITTAHSVRRMLIAGALDAEWRPNFKPI